MIDIPKRKGQGLTVERKVGNTGVKNLRQRQLEIVLKENSEMCEVKMKGYQACEIEA